MTFGRKIEPTTADTLAAMLDRTDEETLRRVNPRGPIGRRIIAHRARTAQSVAYGVALAEIGTASLT